MTEWFVRAHMKTGGIEGYLFPIEDEMIGYLMGSKEYRGETLVFRRGVELNSYSYK